MKIIWMGKLTEVNTIPTEEIPKNATEFLKPKRLFQYCILAIPIIVFFLFCIYIKAHFITPIRMNLLGKIIGVILAVILMSVHELLHAVCFPAKATIYVYWNNYGLGTTSSYPISKKRFVIIAILPSLVLGFIPLILWTFIPIQSITFNTIWCFAAAGGLGAGTVDFSSMINVITKMPKGTVMQISGSKAYYY